jgi:outer membrane receptor protein involved in Fe transport
LWRGIGVVPAQAAHAGDAGQAAPASEGESRAGDQDASRDIVVYGRGLQQVGTATSGSQGVVGYADFENRPIARVGELAENVPGLIATQHSGEGKANQYFLRGFNLDHGTDLAGFVDGAPVNMRTHGHGQGYLDLNFLIPELVERIDYTKGPYHAELGDFANAGSLAFTTKSRLAHPMVEVSGGSFGYVRGLVAGSGELAGGTLLGAFEGTRADGPWVLSENLAKFNALLKYSRANWSLGLSAYANHWRSTDQIPNARWPPGRFRSMAISTRTTGAFGPHRAQFQRAFRADDRGGLCHRQPPAPDQRFHLFPQRSGERRCVPAGRPARRVRGIGAP